MKKLTVDEIHQEALTYVNSDSDNLTPHQGGLYMGFIAGYNRAQIAQKEDITKGNLGIDDYPEKHMEL